MQVFPIVFSYGSHFYMHFNPLLPMERPFGCVLPKYRFKIKRDQEKNSYERCVYESVDDKEPILGYISKIDGRQNSGGKVLIHTVPHWLTKVV